MMLSGAMYIQGTPRPEILTAVMSGFMQVKSISGPTKRNIIYETEICGL